MKKYQLCFLVMVLALAGCQKQTQEDAGKENVELAPSESKKEIQEENTDKKEADEKETDGNEMSGVSTKIEDGKPEQVRPENPITRNGGKRIKGLTRTGVEDAVYCNRQENLNDNVGAEKLLLICPDPLYGLTYYVDYGGDYFIYAIWDGNVELAVEIPGKRLFCRDGKLYFMVEDYGKYELDGLEKGDVLAYDPVDGTVSFILSGLGEHMTVPEKSVTREETTITIPEELEVKDTFMTVYQDGIYYKQKAAAIQVSRNYSYQPENNYYYSFETEELKRMDSGSIKFFAYTRRGEHLLGWNMLNYDTEPEFGEIRLFHPGTGEDALAGFAWEIFCLSGDKVYSTNTLGIEWNGEGYSYKNAYSEIVAFDLENKTEKRYVLDHTEDAYTSAFFVWDDVMYFKDLYCYSFAEEKGAYAHCNLQSPNMVGFGVVSEFYTDGEQLYGLSMLDGKLYRIEKHKDSYKVPGMSFTYDYKFDFLPVAE